MDLINIAYIIFGLIIGSFLNVCIYRIPASREEFYEYSPYGKDKNSERIKLSVAFPTHSICPDCKNRLRWHHNIPFLSWIMLRGRCAYCKARISIRYPFVEIITALSSVYIFNLFGLTPTAILIFIFCCALIVISFIDYDYFIIPDVISLPGTALGLVIALVNQYFEIFSSPIVPNISSSLWGLAIGAGFLWAVAIFYLKVRKIEGLGMGDVKLLAMTGAFLGPQGAFYTIFIGSVFGSVGGLLMILLFGRKVSQHIPFGPYLALATLLYIFTGNYIVDWWASFVVGQIGG